LATAGFRITDRDDEIVRFAGLHMAVEAQQAAAWLEMDVNHLWRRAARLVDRGLLTRERVLHGRPSVYIATPAGLERVGLGLPPARISLAQYEHSLELVWLFIELEREFGYGRVLSERQLRSAELRALAEATGARKRHRPTYGVPLASAARGLHFPDLAVEWGAPNGGLLAVELELTTKGGSRRRRIVGAYRNATHVESVRYYATRDPHRLLERTVASEGAAKVVQVCKWPLDAERAR
jgi:hypothetical protein